jgi:RNA-directed DNA polymerase
MRKASMKLQELRRKIYNKAKTEKHWRFWIGDSNCAFGKVRDLIEKKVRRFVMRRKGLKGFGWKRWSREEIYQKWGLYNDYRIRYLYPKATPS